jgi:hypothetical protein
VVAKTQYNINLSQRKSISAMILFNFSILQNEHLTYCYHRINNLGWKNCMLLNANSLRESKK